MLIPTESQNFSNSSLRSESILNEIPIFVIISTSLLGIRNDADTFDGRFVIFIFGNRIDADVFHFR